ncbi:RNA-binding protein [Bombilactobacillus thymidiniphilus]|uniref:Uncharacterized protein n=1 Tax=Bombilactobacillus thymidiniphilus TaxID=2923363 RepID=A0ABY4PBT8_9LACO|nr:hypothetical protein [Bombilactobacillus thymidiniphilus]UQS83147.1 hypothetical protein MOO47_05005 [Bombilactobacillus thymidiniphilus]
MSLFKQQPKNQEATQNFPVPDNPDLRSQQANESGDQQNQQQYFQDVTEYPVNTAPASGTEDNLYSSSSNSDPIAMPNSAPVPNEQAFPNVNEWQATEEQLNNLEDQAGNLKRILKDQLLNSRTFYNQKLQSTTVVNDAYSADLQQIQQINDSLKRWFGTDAISGSIAFDSARKYFIMSENLFTDTDQRQNNMADLNYFLDDYGILPTMMTISYDEDLTGKWQDYINAGIVNPESNLINIYQYFQNENQANTPAALRKGTIEISPHARVENDAENNIDRIYEGNSLIMRVVKDLNNHPAQIFHYFDDILLSLDHLDVQGNNLLTQFFDKNDAQHILREHYYRLDGSLAVIKSFQDTEPYVQVMNQANVLVQAFNTEQDFIAWWLVNKILDEQTTIILPIDSPILPILLDYPDASYQVIPYITNYHKQEALVDKLLARNLEAGPGILVNDQQAQLKISELTQGQVNVSVVSDTNA